MAQICPGPVSRRVSAAKKARFVASRARTPNSLHPGSVRLQHIYARVRTCYSTLSHPALATGNSEHLSHIRYCTFLNWSCFARHLRRGTRASGETLLILECAVCKITLQRLTSGFSCRSHAEVLNSLRLHVEAFIGEIAIQTTDAGSLAPLSL